MVDQTDIFPDLADPSFQEHANEAIHRFIASTTVSRNTSPADFQRRNEVTHRRGHPASKIVCSHRRND